MKDIHPPEDVAKLEQTSSEDRRSGTYSGQWSHRKKNGTLIEAEIASHQQELAGTQMWYSVANDITERKRAETARHMLVAIVDSSDDAIISKDLDGMITSWNISAQRIFGYEASEAIGRNIMIIIPPELRDEETQILRRLRAGERIGHYETTRVTKQGKRVNVSLTISPVRDSDGKVIGASKIARDITDRLQVEEELRRAHDELETRVQERTAELAESNRALEAEIKARSQAQEELERQAGTLREHSRLLDLANDAIFIRSFDGTAAYWNEGAERLYGWTKQEVVQNRLGTLLQTKFPLPFERIKEAVVREGNWEGELVHTRKDGSRITVASRWTLWRNQEGIPLGWLQINTDITGRKRAEESLRNLSARLLQLQDDERRRIARELHDSAGQILVALDINLALIQKNAETRSPKAVNAINESLGLVKQLSKELRTISHLLHPPLLDEAGLRSAVQWYVDGFAKRSKIPVDLELSSDLGRLPRELETTIFRIVQECLTNIHRHSGSATANIRISRNSDGVSVEVRDHGKGISNSSSRNASTPITPGVGIQGMRERVRQLGGHLKIRSGTNGTTVSATLPVATAKAQRATGAAD
jgi:PAS domain S-box-containing protein